MILKKISLHLHLKIRMYMKYSELHKKLKKAGCYPTGKQLAGHPEWINPVTGITFPTSNHLSEEVKSGTLKNILKAAGLK